jgi:DNA-binding PadR family transcriptional regulator
MRTGGKVSMDEPLDVLAFAKGINELVVLAALGEGPRHGYQIALEMAQRSNGLFVLQHGTLYPILHRLEKAKLVRSAWEEGGGRKRRVYALTEAGRVRLGSEAERCDEVLRSLLKVVGRRRSA